MPDELETTMLYSLQHHGTCGVRLPQITHRDLADDREGIDSRKAAKVTLKHTNWH